ncbi:Diamine acetyltransferase 2 [Porphyridium purpureum]|uniref:Diamine acetyltransferase 2 n=1 Tax=Porphyridium purpureum TaxID=35688 RepID=A0A5J4YL24_PORPP|nr:Diamine acetyltransferase 2 [Porphyridium purpureum]|eukprot:POR8475..scf249_10
MGESSGIRIKRIALDNPEDVRGLQVMMNEYASDINGGGQLLSEQVLAALPETLAMCPTYVGLLALDESNGDAQPEPVGLLNAFWSVSTFKAKRLLNVHDLAVKSSHRRKGIGRVLLNEIQAVAVSLGCCKLTLEVLEHNLGAKKLYAEHGFAPYKLDPSMGDARFLQKNL